jgi:4-alpha-glucanotransferase
MAIWWENALPDERAAVLEIPSIAERLTDSERSLLLERADLSRPLRDALLESLFASGSNLLILPVQDVFGWRDRINRPATVGDDNWTWRMPWMVDRLSTEPQASAVANQLRAWSERYGRSA